MKVIIVCKSVSHGNTKRVADVMAEVLGARVVDPEQADPAELASCDLVGFGSGIFNMSFHPQLREFVNALPKERRGKAFVFATSGFPEPPFLRYLRGLARLLGLKGFEVLDTFSCRGWDTWAPLMLVGGVSKGRPATTDLDQARTFAEGLLARIAAKS